MLWIAVRLSKIWASAAGLMIAVSLAAAAAEQQPLTRIAFGSCADQNHQQPIWGRIFAYDPELFIFAGDNVYGDDRSGTLSELRGAYARAAKIPAIKRLRATRPVLATWDDHDFGLNDAGRDFPNKRASEELFLTHWGVAEDDPRRRRDGVYHEVTFGPEGRRVQIILLDTRFFRSTLKVTDERGVTGKEHYMPTSDPSKTMLGEAQWKWLQEQLLKPAELRLIVSSIQVLAQGHGFERWGNLPKERQKLFGMVKETKANGVIFLSGDRHLGALYRQTDGVPYDLYEITSSGINRSYRNADEPGPLRLGDVYRHENFGSIDIDWSANTVTLAVRDMNGRDVRRVSISISSLRREHG
ncbi:MAG: alkaline phosphatase family protein [Alphaproteobacteria bacterium]|nr:alkaline phosphatase family protein [Alphaproteobacteria bacterium]